MQQVQRYQLEDIDTSLFEVFSTSRGSDSKYWLAKVAVPGQIVILGPIRMGYLPVLEGMSIHSNPSPKQGVLQGHRSRMLLSSDRMAGHGKTTVSPSKNR